MKTIKEIKKIIFKTECKNLLYEGFFRSEPILTMGEKGLIDNYFVYAGNRDLTEVSRPMVAFGIYSDLETTAYINPNIYDENAEIIDNPIDRSKITAGYVKEYEALYEEIRGFAYRKCSDLQKEALVKYIEHLYYLSGLGLWKNYLEVTPEFFDWVKGEGINNITGGVQNG